MPLPVEVSRLLPPTVARRVHLDPARLQHNKAIDGLLGTVREVDEADEAVEAVPADNDLEVVAGEVEDDSAVASSVGLVHAAEERGVRVGVDEGQRRKPALPGPRVDLVNEAGTRGRRRGPTGGVLVDRRAYDLPQEEAPLTRTFAHPQQPVLDALLARIVPAQKLVDERLGRAPRVPAGPWPAALTHGAGGDHARGPAGLGA